MLPPPSAMALRVIVTLIFAVGSEGHGWMTHPPSRNGGSLGSDMEKCLESSWHANETFTARPDCMWFTSSTIIPGEPTLCDPALLTTSTGIANPCSDDHARDWTRKHPWRAPGTAPVIHPCGTHCTSLNGDSCQWGAVTGPIWGKGHDNHVNWTSLPPQEPTVWTRGSAVEVATGVAILHSGGWSYRLCPANAELTEECFARGALKFNSDTAKVRLVNNSVAPFSLPVRHTPDRKWTRIPVPGPDTRMPAPWCKSPQIQLQKENISYRGATFDERYACTGSYDHQNGTCAEGDAWCWQGTHPAGGDECCNCDGTCIEAKDELAFPSPFPASFPIDNPWTFSIIETVEVPSNLPVGEYVLSWRWDAEATPQVWLNCADIRIVESSVDADAGDHAAGSIKTLKSDDDLAMAAGISNSAPVIGLLTQPIDSSLQPLCAACTQYTVVSYKKWIEAAGARVALLQYNGTDAMLQESFSQLSGLVIPGGHCGFHMTKYGTTAARLLQMAEAAQDFPVWGTCQGFQQLAQYAATGTGMHPSILHRTGNDTDGVALNLDFVGDPRKTSRMFADAPPSVITTLATKPVTLNLHHYSVLANESKLHPGLASFFNVVATNTVDDVSFVTLVEGRELPFYASQFHPEKNAFEWDQTWCHSSRVDAVEAHSAEAVEATTYLARFFVAEARKCSHRWNGGVSGSSTISYLVNPVAVAGQSDDAWEQCYLQ